MNVTRFHLGKFSLYAILSTADLILTYLLLQHGRGAIYEGNPIANAWLSSYGWSGLILYKLATVCLLAGIILFVSLYQTRAAGRVLVFACVTLSLVVGYSANIARKIDFNAERLQLRTEQELALYREFFHDFERARREIRSGTCTLPEATDRLLPLENDYWQELLRRRYPGRSDRECLTAFLKENLWQTAKRGLPETGVSRRLTRELGS